MIVYLSVPYSTLDTQSITTAAIVAQRKIAKIYTASPELTPVSGVLCWYNNPDITLQITKDSEIYPFSRALIDSSEILCVVRSPGWEYSNIVAQECSYAAHTNKQVTYIDP